MKQTKIALKEKSTVNGCKRALSDKINECGLQGRFHQKLVCFDRFPFVLFYVMSSDVRRNLS